MIRQLIGCRFKCAAGHKWAAAVGGVWLQMPWCPQCEKLTNERMPAVAWRGIWRVRPGLDVNRLFLKYMRKGHL